MAWMPGEAPPALRGASTQPCIFISHSVFQVVLQKSITTKNRQLIIYISSYKGQVDGFLWKMTFAKRLSKRFV